ncbi:MAG TPA: ABC transporter permease [Burkholderiaceae bacterium]|nr:ABC transporter permease [Burkholderiaceae bacterium]
MAGFAAASDRGPPVRPTLWLDPRVVAVLWRREVLRYLRDRSQLFGAVSRSVLWLAVLGFGLGAALRDIEGYTYAQYILPGVVMLNILFASLQSAFAIVWDRERGMLRQVLVSPASRLSIVAGKVAGGATVALVQGAIPLAFAPLLGLRLTLGAVLAAAVVMFAMGVAITAFGVAVATRIRKVESFGSISNGIVQPLYFLSGAIFPLKGVIGGVGFLDLPESLRDELRRLGIHAIGGGWLVELPAWLQALVLANPISYGVDLLRAVTLGFRQLPLAADLLVVATLPLATTLAAVVLLDRMRSAGRR